jgi:hypothetical protein
MPANVGGFLYAAGLCIASGLLLGAGLLMGQLLIAMGRPRWRRALGGAIVATCALMAVGVV